MSVLRRHPKAIDLTGLMACAFLGYLTILSSLPSKAIAVAGRGLGSGYLMNEGDMLDECGELDIGLRRSQAEAQQAVTALHGVWADDNWADDGWLPDGVEESDRRSAAHVEPTGAVHLVSNGSAATTGDRG